MNIHRFVGGAAVLNLSLSIVPVSALTGACMEPIEPLEVSVGMPVQQFNENAAVVASGRALNPDGAGAWSTSDHIEVKVRAPGGEWLLIPSSGASGGATIVVSSFWRRVQLNRFGIDNSMTSNLDGDRRVTTIYLNPPQNPLLHEEQLSKISYYCELLLGAVPEGIPEKLDAIERGSGAIICKSDDNQSKVLLRASRSESRPLNDNTLKFDLIFGPSDNHFELSDAELGLTEGGLSN